MEPGHAEGRPEAELGVEGARVEGGRGPVGGHRLLVAAAVVQGPAQTELGVEARGIRRDDLAQNASRSSGRLFRQRISLPAVRCGPAELVHWGQFCPPCPALLRRHGHRDDALRYGSL